MTLLLVVVVLLVLLLVRVPLAIAMGVSACCAIPFLGDVPWTLVVQQMTSGVDSFSLVAIPLYLFAGHLMEKGGISERLVALVMAVVGRLRGGLAVAGVMAATLFSGVSGSAAADASATGSVIIPAAVKRGYEPGFIAAVMAVSSCLGPIFPPSILMILYGSITGISISQLFLAGILPGLLIAACLMIGIYLIARRLGYPGEARVSRQEFVARVRAAIWPSFTPIIIVGGILTGIVTATEAGVLACVYSIFVGAVVYRELDLNAFWRALQGTIVGTGMIMFIMSVAGIFGWVLAAEQVPESIARWLESATDSRALVMLLVIVALLLVGILIETIPAAIVFVPVLHPISETFGFDPIHFATVVVIVLLIGSASPPVGILLNITAGIARASYTKTSIYATEILVWMMFAVIIIAYVPFIVTWLPGLR